MCSRMFRCGNIFLRDVSRFYSFDKDYWLRVGVVTGDMYAFCSQVYLTGSSFCAAILLAKCRETGSVIVGRGDKTSPNTCSKNEVTRDQRPFQ